VPNLAWRAALPRRHPRLYRVFCSVLAHLRGECSGMAECAARSAAVSSVLLDGLIYAENRRRSVAATSVTLLVALIYAENVLAWPGVARSSIHVCRMFSIFVIGSFSLVGGDKKESSGVTGSSVPPVRSAPVRMHVPWTFCPTGDRMCMYGMARRAGMARRSLNLVEVRSHLGGGLEKESDRTSHWKGSRLLSAP